MSGTVKNTFNKGSKNADEQAKTIQNYYVWQSKIYDTTRWSFLFGRKQIIDLIKQYQPNAKKVLEVGCGTGFNMVRLAKAIDQAELYGMDVSGHMLDIARKNTAPFKERVQLFEQPYALGDTQFNGQLDVILFSYALTMINPQFSELIEQAAKDIKPGGIVAVTDFHDSKRPWFKSHMGNHHVRMDSHLPPVLDQYFEPQLNKVKLAYGGVWQYLLYIGKKK